MRNFKFLFMGVMLSLFSMVASVNATNYVKDSDLTAETTAATGDTFIMQDVSAGTTDKITLANIFASAANVGASTIVTVGALDSGSITSGFGNIDNGTSNITSGGIWSVDVDGGSGTAAIGAAGAITFGAGSDFSVWFDGTDGFISSTTDLNFDAAGDDHIFSSSDVVVATIDDTGIDIVTNDFTTGGQYVIDVDGSAINAAGSSTYGAGNDAGIWYDGTDLEISTTTGIRFGSVEASDVSFFEDGTETVRIDFSDSGSNTALMLWNRADNALIRVTTGVNHSGGTGFRALVVPNL